MTALMRNGRDRRSGTPVTSAMRDLSACFWLGPDERITSGPAATAAAFKGRIHGCTRTLRKKSDSFPLHRGRRPYMAPTRLASHRREHLLIEAKRTLFRCGRDRCFDPTETLAAKFAVTHNPVFPTVVW